MEVQLRRALHIASASRTIGGVVLALLLLAVAACSSNSPGNSTPTIPAGSPATSAATANATATPTSATTRHITVTGSGRTVALTVELAYTEAQRERGLMAVQKLGDDSGMLFLFAANTNIGFWMKDTLIPLDIAYLDASGRVLEIKHGQPLDESVLTPSQPYRYTLEVAGGWFERQSLAVGAIVSIPTNLPAAQ